MLLCFYSGYKSLKAGKILEGLGLKNQGSHRLLLGREKGRDTGRVKCAIAWSLRMNQVLESPYRWLLLAMKEPESAVNLIR